MYKILPSCKHLTDVACKETLKWEVMKREMERCFIFKGLPALGLAGLNLQSTVKTERYFVTMKQNK